MAAKVARQTEENGRSNAEIETIIVLESDEEEEEDHGQLFEGFLSAIQSFVDKNEASLLREKFATTRTDLACSENFRKFMRRKTAQVQKSNVYIHYKEVLHCVLHNQKENKGKEQDRSLENGNFNETENPVKNDPKQTGSTAHALAGDFENCEHGTSKKQTIVAEPEVAGPSRAKQDHDSDIEIIYLDDDFKPSKSSSSVKHMEVSTPAKSCENKSQVATGSVKLDQENSPQTAKLRRLKRKKYIAKLEKRLDYYDKEIKRLSRVELSLEEMDFSDSSYMKKCKLEEKANDVWNEICRLKDRPTNTGRVTETEVKCKGTGFPQIDKAVKKFLKNRTSFPDIFDVRNLISKVKKKHNLRITPSVHDEIANEVFTDIGNKMQKKRKKDYKYNFGCYLTDDYRPSLDPALNDFKLQQKLEENKKKSCSAMDEVFRKYVHLGRLRGIEGYGDTSATSSGMDSEGDSEEDVPRRSKHKKKRVRDAPEVDEQDAGEESACRTSHKRRKRERESSEMIDSDAQNSDLEFASSQEVSQESTSSNTNKNTSSSLIELDLAYDTSLDADKSAMQNSASESCDLAAEVEDNKEEKLLLPTETSSPISSRSNGKDLVTETTKELQAEKKERPEIKAITQTENSEISQPIPALQSSIIAAVRTNIKLGKLDAKITELMKKKASEAPSTASINPQQKESNTEQTAGGKLSGDSSSVLSSRTSNGLCTPNMKSTPKPTVKTTNSECLTVNGHASSPGTSDELNKSTTNNPGTSSPVTSSYQSPLELFRGKRSEMMNMHDGATQNGHSPLPNNRVQQHNTTEMLAQENPIKKPKFSLKLNKQSVTPKKASPIIVLSDDDED